MANRRETAYSGYAKGWAMDAIIGVGIYLMLGLAIAVAIIAVFRYAPADVKSGDTISYSRAPLAALVDIAEEAQRDRRDQHVLPWEIPTAALAPDHDSHKAAPTLEQISQRLDVLESRLRRITKNISPIEL